MSRYDDDSNIRNNYKDEEVSRKRKGRVDNVTKRRVKTQFFIAFFFAILAIFGYIYVSTDTGDLTYVVRAKESIPVGKIIAESTFDSFEVVALPPDLVETDSFTGNDPQKLIDDLYIIINGESTLYPILNKQQLRPQYFTGEGSGIPNRNLLPDERQIAISVSASRAVAGTIKSGVFVDIYGVTDGISGLLAENIKVLSVSLPQSSLESAASAQLQNKESNLSDYLPVDPIGGTYIILVKSNDVAKFFAVENGGIIYFAMRNADSEITNIDPINARDSICKNNTSTVCRG